MKLSIIIPSYNEAATLKKAVNRVRLQDLNSIRKEIIVVDDGSADATKKILASVSGVKKIFLPANRGKGAAVRAAAQLATGDYVLIQDADLEYDPVDIPALLKPVLSGKARVVYGSRFLGPHKNMLF